MSGGLAYVYDETELFDTRCNLDMVDVESVWQEGDIKRLHAMIESHFRYTGSQRAAQILENWESRLPCSSRSCRSSTGSRWTGCAWRRR